MNIYNLYFYMYYPVFCPMCLGLVVSFVQLFPCSVVFVCVIVIFDGKYQINNPFKTREYTCLNACGISWRPVQDWNLFGNQCLS